MERKMSRKGEKAMRRSVFTAGLGAAFLFGLGALGAGQTGFVSSAQQKLEMTEVKIDNFTFGPAALTVPVGTTVTWMNKDDIPHTVVSTDDSKTIKSKVLDTDEKFSFTFSKPGTYPYFCSIHPKMTGKVIVQ
jgi:plastocyanin